MSEARPLVAVPKLTAKQADYLDTVVSMELVTASEAADQIGGKVERRTTAWKTLERLQELGLIERVSSRGSQKIYFKPTDLGRNLARTLGSGGQVIQLAEESPAAVELFNRLDRAKIPGLTPMEKLLWLAGAAKVSL